MYIGEFDPGAILNKKPVSPRSDKRAKRTTECDTRKMTSMHSGLRCGNIDFKISYSNETRLNNDTE